MVSAQTLALDDRRVVAAWAADCAERVLPLFEAGGGGGAARDAIERARRFAHGELDPAGEIRRRLVAGRAAHEVEGTAARAAARAAAQAAAVAHMGAHALGAAAYAARACRLDAGESALEAEARWQLAAMTGPVRVALRRLPLLGEDAAGPLGPGLLASGDLGVAIRLIQTDLRGR